MTDQKDSGSFDFVLEVLAFFSDEEMHELLWWRTDEEYAPVTFFVNTNDLLAWGCADGERITTENLPLLRQAMADCKKVGKYCWYEAVALFACRLNKMRPQGAAYPKNKAFWPLFDACGPEREVGLGNPKRPGE